MDPNLPKTAGHAPPDWRGLCEELVRHAEIAQSIAVGDGLWDGDDDEFPECLDRARAALAEPVAEWPTDEELWDIGERYLWTGTEDSITETRILNSFIGTARAVLARWGRPAPAPAEGEVAELAEWLRDDLELHPAEKRRVADLLEQRHPAPVPVAEGEVGELVEWLRDRAESTSLAHNALRITRAADLLEQCAQALSEGQHYLAQYQQTRSHTLELRRVEVLPPGALPLPAGEVE